MPTYDYRCADCGHEFEAQQSFTDDALTECPECKGSLKKKFSAVGISFKGSGFYKNDSGGSSSRSSSSSDSSAPSNGSSGDSTSSSSDSASAASSTASSSVSSSD